MIASQVLPQLSTLRFVNEVAMNPKRNQPNGRPFEHKQGDAETLDLEVFGNAGGSVENCGNTNFPCLSR
jgi:hypothetical protein